MEKLFKIVCANFALNNKFSLECNTNFENSQTEAKMHFIGHALKSYVNKREGIASISEFLKISVDQTNTLLNRYENSKSKRFNIKNGLIQNGMRL